jgi:hypothetical protein
MKKVATASGSRDGAFVYLYDGQRIVEVRNGSGTTIQQFVHGTQYIDELVVMRVKDKGDLYIHQDANWNVIGATDLGGRVVEHNFLSPYGELTVHQETGYGNRDGDGDVDSTDKGTVGRTCTGTVSGSCRILDLDFDGDYDSTDATKFDSLTQGAMRSPGRRLSAVQQAFAHQGLLFEPEIDSYQNRARQYDPANRGLQWRTWRHLAYTSISTAILSNGATRLEDGSRVSCPIVALSTGMAAMFMVVTIHNATNNCARA